MFYPAELLASIAKANLGLSIKLADIARQSSQQSLQAAINAANVLSTTADVKSINEGYEKKALALTNSSATFLAEIEKIRERMTTETNTAIQEWFSSWNETVVSPYRGQSTEAMENMLGFWRGILMNSPANKAKG
jgi:ribosomal 50S subunit-associated protein YjgA (DUF615 family)